MRVTVFGATGTVGQALLPLLADHEVVAVSRPRVRRTASAGPAADASTARASQR